MLKLIEFCLVIGVVMTIAYIGTVIAIRLSEKYYENEEVLVIHNVLVFPDGSKEAVLACHKKKDGKIIHTETGATPIE